MMTEESNPSFQKTRDEAIGALVLRGGLNPDQVSALKLDQVHLTTSMLVIEPDEFSLSPASIRQTIRLKLDGEMQRTLIAWLVVRPDGPNNHLFPGAGLEGLDIATINQAVTAASSKPPPAPESAGPPSAGREKTAEPSPESMVKEPPRRPAARPSPGRREERQAVPLDEIESLRKRLADVYDAWSPVMPAAEPAPEAEAPFSPPVEVEPPAGAVEPEVVAPLSERGAPEPAGLSGKPTESPEPGERQIILNLPYRVVVIGSLFLVAVCCLGFVFASGAMFSAGGPAGLLAGVMPSETPTPTETVSPAAPVPSSTPVPAVTATPTIVPSVTPTILSEPTEVPASPPTVGPTPTPVIIVVTATPTPGLPPTDTPVPTKSPAGGVSSEPTATPMPAFKYPAPTLREPEDGEIVPGKYVFLKWEPVGPLADDEWYAVRLVYLQQGKPVYQGDWIKETEWQVPERFYYQADGPALEYHWYVFVERGIPDGSMLQISPESETNVFRWE
jgi:hypothetical protein